MILAGTPVIPSIIRDRVADRPERLRRRLAAWQRACRDTERRRGRALGDIGQRRLRAGVVLRRCLGLLRVVRGECLLVPLLGGVPGDQRLPLLAARTDPALDLADEGLCSGQAVLCDRLADHALVAGHDLRDGQAVALDEPGQADPGEVLVDPPEDRDVAVLEPDVVLRWTYCQPPYTPPVTSISTATRNIGTVL